MMRIAMLLLAVLAVSCMKTKLDSLMNRIASDYVKLVLKVGQYDPDYIDAYFGPEEWKPKVSATTDTAQVLAELLKDCRTIQQGLYFVDTTNFDEFQKRRHRYLSKQLTAVEAKIRMLSGEKLKFDEESKLLYDAVAPTYDAAHFEEILKELDAELPGRGDIPTRLNAFKEQFVIPSEKLDAVFQAAIDEGRRRTKKYITLPDSESFRVEYVTDKAWSGYNWYKGGSHSLIQVNTDFPITIDRAVDLACHEGYPGHHVYNALLEKNLAVGRDWPEFRVYVLFSPQSFIAEGSANYGIEAAFSHDERIRFEKEVLFPLAGLDSSKADEFYHIQSLTAKLNYAGNEAARGYLDGTMTKDEAVDWLIKYALSTKDKAVQRIRFIEKYRSYVINYNWGLDLVRNFIDKRAGGDPVKQWKALEELLSKPFVPSELSI